MTDLTHLRSRYSGPVVVAEDLLCVAVDVSDYKSVARAPRAWSEPATSPSGTTPTTHDSPRASDQAARAKGNGYTLRMDPAA